MTWRIQQLTNDWHNVYAWDHVFTDDEIERALYALAAANPYTSFRAVGSDGRLYRDLTEYRVTP